MGRRRQSLASVGVWALAALCAVVLGLQRYREGLGAGQPDLDSFFLPAAHAIVSGDSPYSVSGYFYSPLVALMLAPFEASSHATEYWTAARVAAGVAACVVGALACTPRGAWMRAGLVCIGAMVTLLWSWPATLDLWIGQVELFVLLALTVAAYAETRGHRFVSGLALGMCAVIKIWPALFAIWLFRRGAVARRVSWLGVLAAAGVALVLSVATGGVGGAVDLVLKPLSGGNQPRLAANSVWGLPRVLFDETSVAEPLTDSPVLRATLTVVLALWVVGLAVITLSKPGPSFVALFNVAFAVILLMPVSHYFYVLYALPTLWWWAARVLERPRSAVAWTACVALLVWWVVVFRLPPAGDGFLTSTAPSLLRIFGASIVAATVSVLAAASIDGGIRSAPSPIPARSRSAA